MAGERHTKTFPADAPRVRPPKARAKDVGGGSTAPHRESDPIRTLLLSVPKLNKSIFRTIAGMTGAHEVEM